MASPENMAKGSRPLRVAVIAAALAVAGCFGAAVALAGSPAAAEQAVRTR